MIENGQINGENFDLKIKFWSIFELWAIFSNTNHDVPKSFLPLVSKNYVLQFFPKVLTFLVI